MGPSEGRDVRQKVRRAIQFRPATSSHSFTKMLGVPIDDGGGEQVQPGHPEMLPLSCRVALKSVLPHFVWRNYPETGKFRRYSCEFEEALVARERCCRSKR